MNDRLPAVTMFAKLADLIFLNAESTCRIFLFQWWFHHYHDKLTRVTKYSPIISKIFHKLSRAQTHPFWDVDPKLCNIKIPGAGALTPLPWHYA